MAQQESIKKADIILLIGVVLISLFFILFSVFNNNSNNIVEFYHDNKLIYKINLNEEHAVNVGNMQFYVEHNSVRALKSDCPNQNCVHTGKISKAGQAIICLPNKVVARIVGKSEVDSYAY